MARWSQERGGGRPHGRYDRSIANFSPLSTARNRAESCSDQRLSLLRVRWRGGIAAWLLRSLAQDASKRCEQHFCVCVHWAFGPPTCAPGGDECQNESRIRAPVKSPSNRARQNESGSRALPSKHMPALPPLLLVPYIWLTIWIFSFPHPSWALTVDPPGACLSGRSPQAQPHPGRER